MPDPKSILLLGLACGLCCGPGRGLLASGLGLESRISAQVDPYLLTLGRFETLIERSPLRITARRLYLIRPAFRYRYGLPVVGASVVGRVPGARELLVTGAWYLAG